MTLLVVKLTQRGAETLMQRGAETMKRTDVTTQHAVTRLPLLPRMCAPSGKTLQSLVMLPSIFTLYLLLFPPKLAHLRQELAAVERRLNRNSENLILYSVFSTSAATAFVKNARAVDAFDRTRVTVNWNDEQAAVRFARDTRLQWVLPPRNRLDWMRANVAAFGLPPVEEWYRSDPLSGRRAWGLAHAQS
ncbi:hypothetical protein GGF32_004551 [Allomyces javanicus]|nr:hypothetical protein GGF32_004551 [Allomyces javanicus]